MASLPPDARDIEAKLLRPGPRYLLGAFSEPGTVRERELGESAKWFGLDLALAEAGLSEQFAGRQSDRWLALLRYCSDEIPTQTGQADLRALAGALQRVAHSADVGKPLDVWEAVSDELPTSQPVSAATLRGRRWLNLRLDLAQQMAELLRRATATSLLPRAARQWSTFDEAHYERIHDQLTLSGLAVIAAKPGAGKSELALSYAHARKHDYDRVFWLRADDEFRLERDVMEMARRILGRPADPAELIREAIGELETSRKWLLIFDSVEDPAFVMKYLPRNPEGHALCTWSHHTRDGDWMRYLSVTPQWSEVRDHAPLLSPLTPRDASRFLADAIGADAASGDGASLAELVAGSRLAAMLAAQWLRTTSASPAEYIAEWKEVTDKGGGGTPGCTAAHLMLRELSGTNNRSGRDADKLNRDRKASVLLQRLRVFDTGTFPAEVLHDPDHEGLPMDDPRLTDLSALGLADRATDLPHVKYFQVHRDVLDAVRAQVRCEQTKQLSKRETSDQHLAFASRTLLKRMRAAPEQRSLDEVSDLVPMALAIAERNGNGATRSSQTTSHGPTSDRPLVAVELLARVAMCELHLGRPRQAAAHISDLERIIVSNKDRVCQALRAPREIWKHIGDHEIYESHLPPLRRMWKLLESIRDAGAVSPAVALFRKLEPLLDDDHLDLDDRAAVYYAGGLVLRVADELEEAKQAASRAAVDWEQCGDRQWLLAARSLLAVLCIDAGAIGEARSVEAGVLEERRRDLSVVAQANHGGAAERVARSEFIMGRVAVYEGRIAEARSHFDEAVRHWEMAFADDPRRRLVRRINQLDAQGNLAVTHALLGETSGAQDDALGAWQAAQGIHGGHAHRDTTMIQANLAHVLRLGGQVVEACEHHRHALRMCVRLWGPGHRITRGVRRGCAESLLDRGMPQQAFAELLRVLRSLPELDEANAATRARAWGVLGRLLTENSMPIVVVSDSHNEDQELLALADDVLQRSARLFTLAPDPIGSLHVDYASCLFAQTEVALRRGANLDAVRLAERALELKRPHVVNQLPLVVFAARLVRARLAAGQTDESWLQNYGAKFREQMTEYWIWLTPSEALESTTAALALDVAEGRVLTQKEIATRLEGATQRLRSQIGDESHQLISRAYAELAVLAHKVLGEGEYTPQKQARIERERDRARPPLDLTEITRSVYMLIGNERLPAAESTQRPGVPTAV